MTREELISEVKAKMLTKSGRPRPATIDPNSKHYLKDLVEEINKHLVGSTIQKLRIRQALYWLENNITEHPICAHPDCNNRVTDKDGYGYHKYCSTKCRNTDPNMIEQIKRTNLEKYGVENVMHVKTIRENHKKAMKQVDWEKVTEKVKKTKLEKYGDEKYVGLEKRKRTNLERYGSESVLGNKEIWKKAKETLKNKYGVDNPMKLEEIKEKAKKTNMQKYGGPAPMCNEEIKEKAKRTNKEKYGKEYTFQAEEIKEKIKKTLLKKYGVEHSMQSPIVKEKVEKTNIEKYGCKTPFQNEEVKKKIRETNLKRYGVENVSQNKEIHKKKLETCKKNYGEEYWILVPENLDHIFKKTGKWKIYTMPSGKTVRYQGYENWMLDELLKRYDEDDILTASRDMPKISYRYDTDTMRRYYPDAFIKSTNTVCECKSVYTLLNDLDRNIAKFNAVKRYGYNFELFIYDDKGNRIDSKELGF